MHQPHQEKRLHRETLWKLSVLSLPSHQSILHGQHHVSGAFETKMNSVKFRFNGFPATCKLYLVTDKICYSHSRR